MYTLVIGDKAYSSWSLRGWLLLAAFDLPYRERLVRMYDPAFDALCAEMAPAATVPILMWEEDRATRRVWETTAIAETLSERHSDAGIWPGDANARRVARVLASAMHAGFGALRGALPMNLHRDGRPLAHVPAEVEADLDRLAALWDWAFAETGGPWLGGPAFSAADAFFAPVVFRLSGYGLVRPRLRPYCERMAAHEAVARWVEVARADPRRIARYDDVA